MTRGQRAASGSAPRRVPEPAGQRSVIVQAGRAPLGRRCAVAAVLRCMGATAALLARRRIRQPVEHLGVALRFDDGSRATVYRETVVRRGPTAAPATLVVEFRLRWVSGRGHALFRVESLLNTPLFVGFPGFVSKLWLAHDANGVYRGIYEWDGPALAHHYARALSRVLRVVSVPGSIDYVVVPGVRRDEFLTDPAVVPGTDPGAWWRVAGVERAMMLS